MTDDSDVSSPNEGNIPLNLCSMEQLFNEINRRCSSLVVMAQFPHGELDDQGRPMVGSVNTFKESSPFAAMGMCMALQHRIQQSYERKKYFG
jgi:hypothetical protein